MISLLMLARCLPIVIPYARERVDPWSTKGRRENVRHL
jgi:hypothetical protein